MICWLGSKCWFTDIGKKYYETLIFWEPKQFHFQHLYVREQKYFFPDSLSHGKGWKSFEK